jgi:phosphate:Na+ symporter
MNGSATVTLLGGLGLFLLGIHHLTEGLKGLAGDSLRRALQRLVSGRFSAVVSGALFTAVIQSSTAAILTVIGFVNAGLVTFSQAVGMIIGATLGTTSTIWLVAIFGLRFRISAAALPMLGIGAFLWLIARGKTRSLAPVSRHSCGPILPFTTHGAWRNHCESPPADSSKSRRVRGPIDCPARACRPPCRHVFILGLT